MVSDSNSKHDLKTIIATVIAANCQIGLASERLKMRREDILLALCGDTTTLTDQLKTSLIIDLFDTLKQTQLALQASLSELTPGDLARTYTAQMNAFASLTAKPIETTEEAPTSIMDARQQLLDRLDNHEERRNKKLADGSS